MNQIKVWYRPTANDIQIECFDYGVEENPRRILFTNSSTTSKWVPIVGLPMFSFNVRSSMGEEEFITRLEEEGFVEISIAQYKELSCLYNRL